MVELDKTEWALVEDLTRTSPSSRSNARGEGVRGGPVVGSHGGGSGDGGLLGVAGCPGDGRPGGVFPGQLAGEVIARGRDRDAALGVGGQVAVGLPGWRPGNRHNKEDRADRGGGDRCVN